MDDAALPPAKAPRRRLTTFLVVALGTLLGFLGTLAAVERFDNNNESPAARRLQSSSSLRSKCFEGTSFKSGEFVDRRAAHASLFGPKQPWTLAGGPEKSLLLMNRALPKKRRRRLAETNDTVDADANVTAAARRRLFGGAAPFRFPDFCKEVDVAILGGGDNRCLLLAQTNSKALPYHVLRYERTGGERAWALKKRGDPHVELPGPQLRKRAMALLTGFFSKYDATAAALDRVLGAVAWAKHATAGKHGNLARFHAGRRRLLGGRRGGGAPAGGHRRVLMTVVNKYDIDLLLNMVASAKRNKIDVSNLVCVCAEKGTQVSLEQAGLAAFYDPGLGAFDGAAAHGTFGDRSFVDMMWYKISAVYIANMLGYDVLFTDCDVVLFEDPWEHLYAHDADSVWMDDGAHTPRFAPFFANTGFYLLKSTWRSETLMSQLLTAYDVVVAWQSHQAVANQFLAEAHSQAGLSIDILDPELFVSGANKVNLKRNLDAGPPAPQPVVFHINFTNDKAAKLRTLKALGLWFLPDECTEATLASNAVTAKDCLARSA